MSNNMIIPYQDMKAMAADVAKSNLFGVKTPEQAMGLMLLSQAEGIHPMKAVQDYHIIDGKPSKKPEAMLRDFIAAGGSVKWLQLNDKVAEAIFSHPQGGSVTIKWTIEMAVSAGLAKKSVWTSYPRAMLRSRCVSEGLRTVYPGATGQLYTPEEVIDFEPVATEEAERTIIGSYSDADKSEDAVISEPQRKRLYALAKEGGKTTEQVKEYLATIGFGSSTEITVSRYDEICEWIKTPIEVEG